MLFYKSLVSFVAAIALAGTVTASVNPVRRSGSSSTCGSTCSSGTQKKCCKNVGTINDPAFAQYASVLSGLNGIQPTTQLGWIALLSLTHGIASIGSVILDN